MVLAITAAFIGITAVWSVVAPLTEAPDEQQHLGLVLYLADGNGYPDYDDVRVQRSILLLCREYSASSRACPRPIEFQVPVGPIRSHPVDEAPDKAQRRAWDDGDGETLMKSINQMGQHPPLYYSAIATIVRAERWVTGGNWSLDRELAMLRLVNVLIVSPIPLLAWWAARRFGLDDVTAAGAAAAMLGLPMLTHIGGALNNDNMVAVLGAVVVALLAGVVRGDRSTRTAVAVGAALAGAMLSKSLGAMFAPLVVVAYAIAWWESRRDDDRPSALAAVIPLVVSGATAIVLAGWWFIRVRLRTGQFAPTVESRYYTAAAAPPGFEPDLAGYTVRFAKLMNVRVWGSFGWHTVRIPGEVALLMTILVVVAVVAALRPPVDGAGNGRLRRAFLLLPVAALFAFVALRAWNLYALTGSYPFIQGRYLLSGVVGLAVLIAIGVRRMAGRWATPSILVVGLSLQSFALALCMRDYWGGPGIGPGGQFRAMAAWSGWPGEAVVVLVGFAALAGLWLVYEVVTVTLEDRA